MKLAGFVKDISQRLLIGNAPGKHSRIFVPMASAEAKPRRTRKKKVALLFDAENVGSRCVHTALEVAQTEGELIIAKVYGPRHLLDSKAWAGVIQREGLDLHICAGCVKGKNSVDMTIAVDGMHMVEALGIDVLVVVSTDSDFAPLARCARQLGKRFHGIGEALPTSAYPSLCDAWTDVSHLKRCSAHLEKGAVEMIESASRESGIDEELLLELAECAQACRMEDSWSDVGQLGNNIRKIRPGFSPKACGFSSFKKLLQRSNIFEFNPSSSGCYVRLRAA